MRAVNCEIVTKKEHKMKKCDICGYFNADNQMFCQQCGNKLSDSPQNPQYHQQQQPPSLLRKRKADVLQKRLR